MQIPQETGSGNELVYDLDEIDGHQFEGAMVEVFRRMGYHTERGKLSNDQGRDIILRTADRLVVVECKHQKAGVGRPIVQKLHSATITYPNATEGLVLTTGCFSPSAFEYAKELNLKSPIKIDLWDHQRLIREAREVGVYFIASSQGTNLFFWVPWRQSLDIQALVQSKHVSQIRSAPRSVTDAVRITKVQREIVPALLMEYRVDKRFQTQVGIIHNAHDHGQRIYGSGSIKVLPLEEQFWGQSSPTIMPEGTLDGKEVPTYFGEPAGPLVEEVRHSAAQRLSCKVRYQGSNNRTYERLCEVKSEDVHVQTKQVLYSRWKIDLQAGPKTYGVHFADDAARSASVVATTGFSAGNEGFVLANGFLCNDCGLIAPKVGDKGGRVCEICGKTLCHAHSWRWPGLIPKRSPRLCSICYQSKPAGSMGLEVNAVLHKYLFSFLLGCIPGLAFFIGKKYGVAFLMFILFLSSLFLAAVYRHAELMVLLILSSTYCSLHWTFRIRLHAQNGKQLIAYRAEWR